MLVYKMHEIDKFKARIFMYNVTSHSHCVHWNAPQQWALCTADIHITLSKVTNRRSCHEGQHRTRLGLHGKCSTFLYDLNYIWSWSSVDTGGHTQKYPYPVSRISVQRELRWHRRTQERADMMKIMVPFHYSAHVRELFFFFFFLVARPETILSTLYTGVLRKWYLPFKVLPDT
jgi:hypothetical protein